MSLKFFFNYANFFDIFVWIQKINIFKKFKIAKINKQKNQKIIILDNLIINKFKKSKSR